MSLRMYVPALNKTYSESGDHSGPPRKWQPCATCGGSKVVPSGDPEYVMAPCPTCNVDSGRQVGE